MWGQMKVYGDDIKITKEQCVDQEDGDGIDEAGSANKELARSVAR